MIPKAFIIEWSETVPWSNYAQVEQDLIISRALSDIFSDNFLFGKLAFRGGTALHKLYLSPQPRYSEDIDLVQLDSGPIKQILQRIREKITPWLGDNTSTKISEHSCRRLYRFFTEFAPVQRLKLKIEINTTEHFSVFDTVVFPYTLASRWHQSHVNIKTYQIEELLGTKLRALYQRRKGRDLFDLDYALRNLELDLDKIIYCFCEYMKYGNQYIPTTKQFIMNLQDKLADFNFANDTTALLRKEIKYNIYAAAQNIICNLIERLDIQRSQ